MSQENGSFLSRDAILAVPLKTAEIDVPEWGGRVRVRELQGLERQEFESSYSAAKQRFTVSGKRGRRQQETELEIHTERIRVLLCHLSLIDEHGNRMFAGTEDVAALGKTSARALDRVFQFCWEMNGFGAEGIEAAGEASEEMQPGESPSE